MKILDANHWRAIVQSSEFTPHRVPLRRPANFTVRADIKTLLKDHLAGLKRGSLTDNPPPSPRARHGTPHRNVTFIGESHEGKHTHGHQKK